MTSFSVVYDACVLYPAPLRDLLMHLAMTNLYRANWTQQIHAEWMRNVVAGVGCALMTGWSLSWRCRLVIR
jgi:hypothetical protein